MRDWWETAQRVVEGTYTMQMNHIESHQLGWNPSKSTKVTQEMYDRIFNMKFLPWSWFMGYGNANHRRKRIVFH